MFQGKVDSNNNSLDKTSKLSSSSGRNISAISNIISTNNDIVPLYGNGNNSRAKRSACINCQNDAIQDAVCPWHHRLNVDDYRQPSVLVELVCDRDRPRIGYHRGYKCADIEYEINVKRISFGSRKLVDTRDKIRVGCTPVLDCSRHHHIC